MNTEANKTEYLTRDAIMKLLSDDEIARVSARESGPTLVAGDEYVNLMELTMGVRRMETDTDIRMSEIVPRSAVAAATWTKICAHLEANRKHWLEPDHNRRWAWSCKRATMIRTDTNGFHAVWRHSFAMMTFIARSLIA